MDQFQINAMQVKLEGGTQLEEALAFMGYTKMNDNRWMKKFGFNWYIATDHYGEWEILNYFLSGETDDNTGNRTKIGLWGGSKLYKNRPDVKSFEDQCRSIAASEREIHRDIGYDVCDLIEFNLVLPEQNEAEKMGLL